MLRGKKLKRLISGGSLGTIAIWRKEDRSQEEWVHLPAPLYLLPKVTHQEVDIKKRGV